MHEGSSSISGARRPPEQIQVADSDLADNIISAHVVVFTQEETGNMANDPLFPNSYSISPLFLMVEMLVITLKALMILCLRNLFLLHVHPHVLMIKG